MDSCVEESYDTILTYIFIVSLLLMEQFYLWNHYGTYIV